MRVSFFGVRGSIPCSNGALARYGGNTSSVVVEAPGSPPILLDLGTGVRQYGERAAADLEPGSALHAVALVTHLHWDHVQGLPFFVPVLKPGGRLDVFSPAPGGGLGLAEAFDKCMCPPYFPVRLAELPGEVNFVELEDGTMRFGEVTVTSACVPHVGPTMGFRLEWRGRTVVYIPDHQQPTDGSLAIDRRVASLVAGADLLIHDAQYTRAEFESKAEWGHSTIEYAVEVAAWGGVRTLALFHHDPTHGDELLDELAAEGASTSRDPDLEVLAAHEGLTIHLPEAGADAQRRP
ncbi:MAG: MBL fold metallo-hydrolase [Acidimicrobiia bacterium]|nr:MBL fold metallo-hydrolase [Acidimicrobiia bacterium]